MERAFYMGNMARLNDLNDFSRVYYGAEFCMKKIPELCILKKVFHSVINSHKKFTFLTPYVTNEAMQKLIPLLRYLNIHGGGVEVIVNDWGVLKLIKEKFKNIECVLGRLLTKQRRDPRAYNILLGKKSGSKLVDDETKRMTIIIPKKVPRSLYRSFKGSVINVPIFHQFLLDNGIRRVEIDNLLWDMKIEIPKNVSGSVYLPYGYITTTRLCGLVNLTYSSCKYECKKFFLSFKSGLTHVPLYSRGNTIFYESMLSADAYLSKRHIDRIIWEAELPV